MGASGTATLPWYPDIAVRRLYAVARDSQWQLDDALDWAGLSRVRLPPAIRTAMGQIYGDVLFAESFGLELARRLSELAVRDWQRAFGEVQLGDERRHVEFFARVHAAVGTSDDVPEALLALRSELATSRDYHELLLHSQVLESAARELFVSNARDGLAALARGIRLPGSDTIAALLRSISERIGRDESRHLAFGTLSLRAHLQRMAPAERHALEDRAAVSARLMYASLSARSPAFARIGSRACLLDGLWRAMSSQLARLDLEIGAQPGTAPTGVSA